MSAESPQVHFEDIPERFQPLFLGSAREALFAAGRIITESSLEEQVKLLYNNVFHQVVKSALINLDEKKGKATTALVSSFHPDVQSEAIASLS